MGLRGWTYGYDYYSPETPVCYHMYAIHRHRENRLSVPHFGENKAIFGRELANEAMARLTGILETNDTKQYNPIEKGKYAMGQIRTAAKYYRTFGIHPETRLIENHLCWFVGEDMQNTLLPALRGDGMGIDYSLVRYEFVDPAPDQP
jgi:hypothetical protein